MVDLNALESKLDRLVSGQFEHDPDDPEHSETPALINLIRAAVEEIRGRRAYGCGRGKVGGL